MGVGIRGQRGGSPNTGGGAPGGARKTPGISGPGFRLPGGVRILIDLVPPWSPIWSLYRVVLDENCI